MPPGTGGLASEARDERNELKNWYTYEGWIPLEKQPAGGAAGLSKTNCQTAIGRKHVKAVVLSLLGGSRRSDRDRAAVAAGG